MQTIKIKYTIDDTDKLLLNDYIKQYNHVYRVAFNNLQSHKKNKLSELINLNNIDLLDNLTKETLKNLGYDKDYKINYGYNYFPKKKYKSVTYKEGMYESLVITLGTGEGDNWWCVVYPPLCFVEAKQLDTNNIVYKSKLLEIIRKFFD